MKRLLVALTCVALFGQPSRVLQVPLVGDGIADNTSAINKAVSVPVTFFIPCGTYLFTSISVGSDDVIVIGKGDCTVMKAAAESENLFTANGHANVVLQGMAFDLTSAPNSPVVPGTAVFRNVKIAR